jgi:hypothetical protein
MTAAKVIFKILREPFFNMSIADIGAFFAVL